MPRRSQRQQVLESIEQRILAHTLATEESRPLLLTLALILCPERLGELLVAFNHVPFLPSVNALSESTEAQLLLLLAPDQNPLLPLFLCMGLREDEFMVLVHLLGLDRDPVLANLELLRQSILSRRYLAPRERVSRPPNRLDWLLYDLDNRRFKQEVRTTRTHFWQLVQRIQGHFIFHNRSRHPQRPVEHQLLVAMKRFGTFGNGAAVGCIARHFGISGQVASVSHHRRLVI
jgi:hypothetical protein